MVHWWHYLIATSLFYYINGHCSKFATSYRNMLQTVFLPIPKKSNEYRYLKCTAVSISILNVEKYCGQYQYPVKYWSIFQYRYPYFFLKHILLLTFNMYVKNKYLIFIFWSDHVWQLDEVESFLPLHKDWLFHLVLVYKY